MVTMITASESHWNSPSSAKLSPFRAVIRGLRVALEILIFMAMVNVSSGHRRFRPDWYDSLTASYCSHHIYGVCTDVIVSWATHQKFPAYCAYTCDCYLASLSFFEYQARCDFDAAFQLLGDYDCGHDHAFADAAAKVGATMASSILDLAPTATS